MDYDYHLPLVERLQAIPGARTGKKLIIKLPKVATSENDSLETAMIGPWSFRRGKKLRVTGTHEAYGFQNESDIPKAGWGKKLQSE